MVEENGKVPVGIVNMVVDKIASFTKEVEIMRAQLPKEQTALDHRRDLTLSITKLTDKVDKLTAMLSKAMSIYKVIFGIIALVVFLSFAGAQIMSYYELNKIQIKTEQIVEQTVKKYNDLLKDR